MSEAGLPPRPVLRWNPEADELTAGGRRRSLEQELSGPDAPTAVVCSNDLGAIALIEFADRLGLRVPQELSVVGFDNVHFAGLARIALTTVAQPLDELARAGLEMIMGRIQGREAGPPRSVFLPATLTVRGSTARPAPRPDRPRA
ncbi:MAG: substrate-binding domain-containing protein, partial [Gaiellales bacterium]